MKFTTTVASLAVLLFPTLALADSVSVAYDQAYDNGGQSLLTTSCSDGSNGLASRYGDFGGLPGFPNIGAAGAVGGWNSAACGTCWQLTFSISGQTHTLNVVAMDHAGAGEFNLSLEAMNSLTGGLATQLGRITANAQQVDNSLPDAEAPFIELQ